MRDKQLAIQAARSRVHSLLHGKTKKSKLIGCSSIEFRRYLRSKGWTWKEYGKTIELDHIIGLSDAYDQGPEAFLRAQHYTNLRPLSISENRSARRGRKKVVKNESAGREDNQGVQV